jgi:hypothetical protein
MKNIIVIFLSLAVFALVAIGLMYIFEVQSQSEATELLTKILAAILLIGGSTALIAMLTGRKRKEPDEITTNDSTPPG